MNRNISKVAVLGSGIMGSGIACHFANIGVEVLLLDIAPKELNDKEIKEVDRFVKKNTLNRFGPVRQVKPLLVFEIAFEGVSLSSRHKSGVSVRFPRILRQRHDKKISEANSVEDLKKLLV